MTNLDVKISEIFSEESIYKNPSVYSCFSGINIPSFIKDWLLKRYSNYDNSIDYDGIYSFLSNHLMTKDSNVKGRLLLNERIKLLARIIIEVDVKNGVYKFGIPDIGIRTNEGQIGEQLVRKHPELHEGEVWGMITLSYYKDDDNKDGFIEMIDFKPFKPYAPDLEIYKNSRLKFSLEEWVDFMISNMDYNPRSLSFADFETKIMFLSRLLVFVEPNLNLIELAPKGTGKSYIFNNLSKHGWMLSGGKVTRAKLFYDIGKQQPGIICNYDFVAMDEIKTISFDNSSELQGALKSYLEQKTFSIGNVKQTSSCGMILLGNIDLTRERLPKNNLYFNELPVMFRETALLERFHGLIEGWKLPRITEDMKLDGYALNIEYFSEILNQLRTKSNYMTVVDEFLIYSGNSDLRDIKAIKLLCSGYLKLLFPNVENVDDISPVDFFLYCYLPAMKKREIIRHQLSIMDPEYKDLMPNIKIKGYND